MIVRPENPQRLIASLKEKPLVLYGMGGAGEKIGHWCEKHQIAYLWADRMAAEKQQSTNQKVLLPETMLKEYADANIAVTSIMYYNEIVEWLLSRGVSAANIVPYWAFMAQDVTWRDLEDSTLWGLHEGRVALIAGLLPDGIGSVADYGEGRSALRKYLKDTVNYYPFDYKKRTAETVLCDFDKDELPAIHTEASVCTATLVFLEKAEQLIAHLCEMTEHTIIVSYVTTDIFPEKRGRRTSGYLNDYTEKEWIDFFQSRGFLLQEKQPDPANRFDMIYKFSR